MEDADPKHAEAALRQECLVKTLYTLPTDEPGNHHEVGLPLTPKFREHLQAKHPGIVFINDRFTFTDEEQQAMLELEAKVLPQLTEKKLREACETNVVVKFPGDYTIYLYPTPYIKTLTAIIKKRYPDIEIINERFLPKPQSDS